MIVKKDPTKVRGKRSKILLCRSKEGKFMKFFKIAEFWKIFILCFISHILYYDTHRIKEKRFEDMSVSIRDYTLVKVVQTSHYKRDVRYGASRVIQCSCMSLISVSWTLFRSPGLWNKFDLDFILGKGDQLLKCIGKFRYLGVEDIPQEFMIEIARQISNCWKVRLVKLQLGHICYLLQKL